MISKKDNGTLPKKYGNDKSKKNCRVTKTHRVGMPDDTVDIKPASSDE